MNFIGSRQHRDLCEISAWIYTKTHEGKQLTDVDLFVVSIFILNIMHAHARA